MSKVKTSFFCQSCGQESPKWVGKCNACGAWNSYVEELIQKDSSKKDFIISNNPSKESSKATLLSEIETTNIERISVKDFELNRCLGGGLVVGSVTLVAGEPGIGKSTLFLQMALEWRHGKVLYVSGEESTQQIKIRANRMGIDNSNLYVLSTTETEQLFKESLKIQPSLIIVDSIQTLESPLISGASGSVSQIKECAAELVHYAKTTNTPIVIIGHITKDGNIAGPKILEHMVDTVLQFEGDRHYAYRILRTLKNRFGSTSEIGIYEMLANGMRPILNPSEILLSQHKHSLNGIAIAATIEGLRPLMIEVQALVSPAVYGSPQRTVSGYDLRRIQLLLAVLEKRGGFHFGAKDVFVNIAGGIKVEDPSIELALVSALLSSYEDKAIPNNICMVGEVGLSGEIRAVSRIEQRISEAEKLGMDCIIIPQGNTKSLTNSKLNIAYKAVAQIEDLYSLIF